MKKHFLLLLWMTLLPLAGWAVKPTVSGLSGATGLRYDGQLKALITGSIGYPSGYDESVGNIQFVVKTGNEEPTDPEISAATSTFPEKTDAKLYYVFYRLTNDGSYYNEDGDWTMVPVRINKAETSYSTEIVGATGLVYNGDELDLIGTAPVATFGTVQYKLGDGDYSANAPVAINAGTYTVYYKVDATDNWKAIAESSIQVTIDKATATVTAPTAIEGGLTYNRAAQALVNAGSVAENGVVLKYSLEEDGEYTTTVPTATDAGDYTVYYKAEGANYSSEVGNVAVNIAQLDIKDDIIKVTSSATQDQTFTGAQITPRSPKSTILYYGSVASANKLTGDDFSRSYGENINVGEGTITLTGKGNYTGTRIVTFSITPANIADVDIAAIADQSYAATEITPEVNATFNTYILKESDFNIAYTNNKNAGIATVTITPKDGGNFTGESKIANFNISKATLTVTADSKEKYFGSADPATTYTLSGFLSPDNKDNINLTGEPTITRESAENVGSYVYTLNVNTLESDNYAFEANPEQGSLTIKAATAIVTPTAIEAQTYGYKLPATLDKDAFAFTTSGLKIGATITSMDYTVKNAEGVVQDAGKMLDAGTYTVIPSNAVCDADGYTITYDNVTLTVNPLTIKLAAQPQKVKFGTGEPKLEKNGAEVEGVYTTWTDNVLQLQDAEGNTLGKSKAAFVAQYSVWKEDFVESLTWEEHDGTVANPGIIKVNLKNDISSNFDVQPVNGDVTYTGVESDITITRLDATENPTPGTEVAEKLKKYHGVTANIKLNATSSIEAFNTIKANRWYSLVLPFNTSVREVSQAFGYAVVDIMDENSSNTTDIDFRLYLGDLEANKPFIFKVDKDIDLKSNPVTFTGKEIVYSDEPVASTADGKVKYIGVYDGKTGFSGHEYFFSLGSGNISGTKATSYVVPMGAYIHMEEQMDGMANSPEFHIEEPDGMTTSIKAIDFAKEGSAASSEGWYNLNGVQLESAPNQKGVYIQNGKKIVIK